MRGEIAIVEGRGPSSTPPVIRPRSAILHMGLRRAASLAMQGVETVSTAARIAIWDGRCQRLRQLEWVSCTISRFALRSGATLNRPASVISSVLA